MLNISKLQNYPELFLSFHKNVVPLQPQNDYCFVIALIVQWIEQVSPKD